ncbi:Synchronized import protein 1 [Spathaspora sp. JA1]|nr:Synchronized import protein 1 [Spathaspora sp. JA1]
MGKLKRNKKNARARLNPIASSSSADVKKDASTIQSKIVPLINKLSSTVANDKSMALGAITVLAEDQRMRGLLLKEKLVPILMEKCLNDSNDEIVVESFGLLRNLCIEQGYDVITYIWRNNIWTTIESCLDKINTSFKYLWENPTEKQDKSKVELLYDFTDNILNLIMVLASGSDEIFDSILDKIDPIIGFVVQLIQTRTKQTNTRGISDKLFNSTLEFIYEFSTESAEFIIKLNDLANLVEFISKIETGENKLAYVYLKGIEFNGYEVLNNQTDQEYIATQLHDLYTKITTIDLQNLKSQLVAISNPPDNTQKDISKQDLSYKSTLSCIEVTLDIITSMLEYLSSTTSETLEPIQLSSNVSKILISNIYPLIRELLQFEINNEGCLQLLEKILGALNNLTWLMVSSETFPVEWYDISIEIWNIILKLSSQPIHIQDVSLNILWGLVKSLGGQVSQLIPSDMINSLITSVKADNEDELRLYLSVVGFLGNVAPIIGNTAITKEISNFLMNSIELGISQSSNLQMVEILIESLNLIYEIFGDSSFEYDLEIYVGENYSTRLSSYEPEIKQIYKKLDKNKHPQLKLKLEETWLNLTRFIPYKNSERV